MTDQTEITDRPVGGGPSLAAIAALFALLVIAAALVFACVPNSSDGLGPSPRVARECEDQGGSVTVDMLPAGGARVTCTLLAR